MKKTLFLGALSVTLCGQAFGTTGTQKYSVKQTLTNNLELNQNSYYLYNDGVDIGSYTLYLHQTSGGYITTYIKGLEGSGTVKLERSNDSGSNSAVLYVDGDTSSFSGKLYGDQVTHDLDGNYSTRIILGSQANNANGMDLSAASFEAKAVEVGLGCNVTLGSLTTTEATRISAMTGVVPTSITSGNAQTVGRNDANAVPVTDGSLSRTMTLESFTLNGGIINNGVALILNGSGSMTAGTTLNGTLTVNSTATLNYIATADYLVTGSEKARTTADNGFGTADYAGVTLSDKITLQSGSKVQIRGAEATLQTDGTYSASGGGSTTYYINSSTDAIDMSGAKAVVVSAKNIALNQNTKGLTTETSLTLTGDATVSINGNRLCGGDITIGNGCKLTMETNDSLQYSGTAESKTLTINGELAMGSQRLSIGNENNAGQLSLYKLVMNGGTVTGDGDGEGALDFFSASNLVVSGNSTIKAPIRVRNNNALKVEVTGKTDSLTISGTMMEYTASQKGAVTKIGAGKMTLSAENTMTGGMSVNEGTLVAAHASALGKGAVTVAEGATLEIGADITATGFSSLIFADGANATVNGTLALGNGNVTLNTLTLGTGGTLTLGDHSSDLTSTTLAVKGDSTLNADLVLQNGGTLDFSSGAQLTMGCDVTIGNEVTVKMDSNQIASIQNGSELTLIKNIDVLTLNEGTIVHFIGADDQSLDGYGLRLEAGQDGHSLLVTPEPTTATLSLLALAGLAARRKRH